MKKRLQFLLLALSLCLALAACSEAAPQTFVSTLPTATAPTQTDPTDPPEPPEPEHSDLHIPDLSVEDVITYFNEVCLDAEYSEGSGDPSLIQKWKIPILYRLNGTPTDEDLQVLKDYCEFLNGIEGFPGIREASSKEIANTQIHFCNQADLLKIMGSNFSNADGAVTYWYNTEGNDIYKATICIRSDLRQEVRNSVILEEIYNGLGATQDTALRKDSIIYAEYSIPQSLTAVDELIMKLLYHPQIKVGMNDAECEIVIRQLYY